ncbi:Activity-regulated cytoskeleton-associated protein [Aphis craccivora]|uniref:Activity-regulated cytoskeleton-associated protein n=1 Tax=Aphis craccivora TaxID=307492 RepID=A0A6G0Y9I5_APHCR|nr:Activity-regulated cytoskeleton-associated protein [Aphis craccivora]
MGYHIGTTAKSTGRNVVRALNLPRQEFKSKFLEEFNGDKLQKSLQSELLSTVQTKAETLGGYVLHKYQLF